MMICSSLQTGPIPLQYLVKPTRKRRRASQSAAQGHSDGVNTSPTSESDSQSDKVHSPAAAQPSRASSAPSPAGSHNPSPPTVAAAAQSPNGTTVTNNNGQRHSLASKPSGNTPQSDSERNRSWERGGEGRGQKQLATAHLKRPHTCMRVCVCVCLYTVAEGRWSTCSRLQLAFY